MAIRKTKLDGLGLERSLANNDIKKNGHWVTKSGEHIISNHASEAHRFSFKWQSKSTHSSRKNVEYGSWLV